MIDPKEKPQASNPDRTGGFARYHEQRTARHSHTYSTWCIVTINILDSLSVVDLILCYTQLHRHSWALEHLEVVRIVRHAEVVGCSTSFAMPAPSSSS